MTLLTAGLAALTLLLSLKLKQCHFNQQMLEYHQRRKQLRQKAVGFCSQCCFKRQMGKVIRYS